MKKIISLLTGLIMTACMIPQVSFADEDITVNIGIYDYTAPSENSVDGVVLDNVSVSVPNKSMAMTAIEKALTENGIKYLINDNYGYISMIDGLAEYDKGDESGWMFSVNDSFDNLGANATAVSDGDTIKMHYSVTGYGTDVGNYFTGGPAITKLILGTTELIISAHTDDTGATNYYLGEYSENGENRQLSGNGEKENPYIIPAIISENELLCAEVFSTLDSHYISFDTSDGLADITAENDYTENVSFCLQTVGGYKKTYYTIQPINYTPLPDYSGEWVSFRGNNENMGITTAKTPRSKDEATLKWAVSLSDSWDAGVCPPIILNDAIYTAIGNKVIILDKETGNTISQSEELAGSVRYAMNPLTYGGGMIFVPINNGRIQALRADNLESLWISEALGGQITTPITYKNGYIYTGTWNGERNDGAYFCLSVADDDKTQGTENKSCKWKIEHPGGFYWAGAYITDDYMIFGSDDGDGGSDTEAAVLYSVKPDSGEIIDKIDGIKGDIRSSVSYDKESGFAYFTTKNGSMHRVSLNDDGTFDKNESIELNGMCTGTPLVYKGLAYIGVSQGEQFAGEANVLKVIDVSGEMEELANINTTGYVQSSVLLTNAYDMPYVYATYNYTPGGLCAVNIKDGQITEIFTPTEEMSQYCLCSPICDSDGTVYYKNDSGYLFAISTVEPKKDTETSGNSGGGGGGGNSVENKTDTSDTESNTQVSVHTSVIEPNSVVNTMSFDDTENHWAKDYISDLATKGIINGKTEKLFAPEDNITRAEFITLLYRICKSYNDKYVISFNDVNENEWYSKSVNWAYVNNITKGVNENEFAPDENISREQIASFISRFAKYMNYRLNEKNEKTVFSDNEKISDWAMEDVMKMQLAGIINGKENNNFAPQDFATRAETAKILSVMLGGVSE